MPESTWKPVRWPRSVYGPSGIKHYRLDVTPSRYITVTKFGAGVWEWKLLTTEHPARHGYPMQLAHGVGTTLAFAKASAEGHIERMGTNA